VPLPYGGKTPWPPAHCGPVNAKIATWSAWYGGDPDELSAAYAAASSTTPAPYQGGSESTFGKIASTIQRWFWGSTPTAGQPRGKLHVPVAADIASASAGLLFSEPPKITAADSGTQDWLADATGDGLQATLLEAAEIAAALSGVYLRVVWDHAVRPEGPWLAVVHPDAAVPQWTYDRLSAVTFWRVVSAAHGKVRRHLEHHESGSISHGLYEGTDTELGMPIPLTEAPDLAALAEFLTDGNVILTGVPRLTAVYVPNIRPNRIWRNVASAAPLGRSDYVGIEPAMDALDETMSSWMRDIRLGKARLIVPRAYLQSGGRGGGAWFDAEQEIIAAVDAMPAADGLNITPNQFAIRVIEHQTTANDLFAKIITLAGYDGQTFGLMGNVATTATETNARERKSLITRDRKILYWRPVLIEIIETLLAIARTQFNAAVTPQRVGIEFAPGVSIDPEAQARTLQMLHGAEAVSAKTKVEMLHPDWEDDAVAAEVAAITSDRGAGLPGNGDPFAAIGRLNNPPPPEEPPAE
jgi:A118 family predicted phage portal protein